MIPIRSLLFVPAINQRALEKPRTLPCDGLILDLEDLIPPARKDEARLIVAEELDRGDFVAGLQMARVNAVTADYFEDDIKALAKAGAQAVLVPKVECAKDILSTAAILDSEAAAANMQIWFMIESALGVMNLREICTASSRLAGMIIGPNDLLKNLKASASVGQEAVLTSYGLCLIAARAYGLVCIDGIYKEFKDADGFQKNCAQGKLLGFDGKSLIHPAQIAQANASFGPTEAEIDLAKRQIEVFEQAEVQGLGVATLDGVLVEGLHVDTARKLLEMADAIAKQEG